MCNFFSLVSDGNGKPYYFDWKQREDILSGKIKVESPDSHTSIADFYGFKGKKEDKLNKYEYNPLTEDFKVDQINTVDDKCLIEKFCRDLDFKTIVEPLIVKKIIHPFKDKHTTKVTKKDIALLKEWASVWDSVWDSVRASVGNSVGAYTGSIFTIWNGEYKFTPAVELWKRGFVASFDGKTWRLHSGKKAEIVYEWTPDHA